jgi:hypothetical protein
MEETERRIGCGMGDAEYFKKIIYKTEKETLPKWERVCYNIPAVFYALHCNSAKHKRKEKWK